MLVRVAALGAALLVIAATPALADVQPYGMNDAGGFHDVLPPGTNGLANGLQLAAFLTTGARPAHNDDQLAMYRDLIYATPGLKAEDLGRYYKDSTFGVKLGDDASTINPRADSRVCRMMFNCSRRRARSAALSCSACCASDRARAASASDA